MGYRGLELKSRVAVVIGGTSGLGRTIMLALAEAGADVVPTSLRAEQVDVAAREAEARGRRALRLTSDVVDRVFLASDSAAFVPGITLPLDGGSLVSGVNQ